MTVAEREFIDRIGRVLALIASLQPRNPADLEAKASNLNLATLAARHATCAVTYWRSGALDFVRMELDDAERVLALPATPALGEGDRDA